MARRKQIPLTTPAGARMEPARNSNPIGFARINEKPAGVTISLTLNQDQVETLAAALGMILGAKQAAQPECGTMSLAEAAEYLGVSRLTVRRRIEAGTLRRVPHLAKVRIPRECVIEYANGNAGGRAR